MLSKNAKIKIQWSLAGRLITLYALTASISLLLACGFLYWILLSNIDHEHQALLSAELVELHKALQQSPLNPVRLKQIVGEESKHVVGEVHSASFHPSSAHYSYFRVLNPQKQQLLVETTNITFDVKIQTSDKRVFLLITNVTQDEILLVQYQEMLGIVLLIGVCFSTLAGFWVTKKGLRPLNKITQAIQTINIHHLHETISSEKWPKELSLLVAAFGEMLNRLDDSFARLSQFSADLAHELRTPINNLMGETEVALTRQRTPSEYQQILESNMEELNRINRMIDELLFLSRAESPETKINCELLAFENELKIIHTFYEGLAADKNIEIRVEGCAQIYADPLLLQRVLNNLIANAINYTHSGGQINLLVKEGAHYTEIQVCDNGLGIDAKELPKIFDRFFRADKARVKNTQGSGLGLSIVKSIMELHKGTVSIKSKMGQGTSVILRFPYQNASK